MMRSLKKNWFLFGLAFCVFLALAAPSVGKFLTGLGSKTLAVVVIFFMSGVTVDARRMKDDLGRWGVHALIQTFSLLLLPALILYTSWWVAPGPLKLGLFLVAALPTTVSSCVAFTAAAGGRVSCALINAVLGNMLGVVVSPLVLGLLARQGGAVDLAAAGKTMASLSYQVLAPFVVGQVVSRLSHHPLRIVAKVQPVAAPLLVLLILFCAFCDSARELGGALGEMLPIMLYLAALHVVVVILARLYARVFELTWEVTLAVVFCASQKTVAMSLPLAVSFFGDSGQPLAVIVLPIIFYHVFQLAFGGVLIGLWSRRKPA